MRLVNNLDGNDWCGESPFANFGYRGERCSRYGAGVHQRGQVRQCRHRGDSQMTDYRVAKGEAKEDQVTAAIEKFTAQIPSSVFLAAALASMAVSLGMKAAKKEHGALFVGQWAAPFLILGIYNKLVKQLGSDADAAPGGDQDI
jgi:hypothetical protein